MQFRLSMATLLLIFSFSSTGFCKGVDSKVERLINAYRTGKYSSAKAWTITQTMDSSVKRMSKQSYVRFRQFQANLSYKAGYPILASFYALDSIKASASVGNKINSLSWKLLFEVSREKEIKYLLEDLARFFIKSKEAIPEFGNDWNYIVASLYMKDNKPLVASQLFNKLTMQDRYYMPAQYQLSLLEFENGNFDASKARLEAIIDPITLESSPLKEEVKSNLVNYSHMALARMYYEKRDFLESITHYRKVEKTSSLFYDALFEQSWALFLSGRPKHALGTLYGVNSPYFSELHNPEAKVLESMVYFWMCRYDDSRNALADFAENYGNSVESLGIFLDRKRLSDETAYQLFENLIAGVSSESLGIPRNVLKTAATRDSMLLVRDQLATIMEEKSKLESQGIFSVMKAKELQIKRLNALSDLFKNRIGSTFLSELRHLKQQYDDLYSQSQFLYLELLMSEKEQLLGRQLHADNRITAEGIRGARISDWSIKSQGWKDNKQEYWWDEIGYQIIDVEPQCKN